MTYARQMPKGAARLAVLHLFLYVRAALVDKSVTFAHYRGKVVSWPVLRRAYTLTRAPTPEQSVVNDASRRLHEGHSPVEGPRPRPRGGELS